MTETIIQAPDTTACKLEVVKLESYLQLRISSDADLLKAREGLNAIAHQKTQIEYLFRKPLADAAAALESLRELRNTFTDPLERIDQYVRSEILRHSNELAAAADKVRLELEKKAAEEQADPWEVERIVPGRATIIPASPKTPGVRKLPAKAIIKDFKKLVLAAAEAIQSGDDSFLEDLLPNEQNLSNKARMWGAEQFEKKRPGCEFFQGNTVTRR